MKNLRYLRKSALGLIGGLFAMGLLSVAHAAGDHAAEAQKDTNKAGERQPAAVHAQYGKTIADVEELVDNLPQHVGSRITVPGEVRNKTAQSFVLESGGWINDEILVVAGPKVNKDQFAQFQEDNNVSVIGTVKTGTPAELKRELGGELDTELEAEIGGARAYIVAEQVVPQPD